MAEFRYFVPGATNVSITDMRGEIVDILSTTRADRGVFFVKSGLALRADGVEIVACCEADKWIEDVTKASRDSNMVKMFLSDLQRIRPAR